MNDNFEKILTSKKFEVDHHGPIPLYHQIYLHLRDLIIKGKFQPGDMLPPEMELSEHFDVGRHTIRQALAKLVDEHLVERFSGRGSFVRRVETHQNFYLDRSFTQQMQELGIATYSEVLEKYEGIVDENTHPMLKDEIGLPYLQLNRLRYGDDIPLGVQNATIITRRCPDLDQYDFSQESLYRILTSVYQLEMGEIYHEICASVATDEQAGQLQVDPGDPILIENALTRLADGEPIEALTSYYRADKYRYSMRFRYRES